MKTFFNTKRLCRAAVIAALYTALTYAFMPFAFGSFQIRPAEALCILPLFYAEAIPALAIGCALSNLASPYLLYDVCFGSLITLSAAFGTYMVGVFVKNSNWKFILGGLFPVLLNALFLPLYILFLCGGLEGQDSVWAAYSSFALSLLFTQAVWVYLLGSPINYTIERLQNRKIAAFTK